jgi:bacillithiol biosynthesis deacetylase BshB1
MTCDALFLSPHPDDVELFCGATAAVLAAGGHHVVIADLTRGELASNGTPEERRACSLRAATDLGASEERPVLGLPDGSIDPHDEEQLEALVDLVRRLRPRWLFAPWVEDRHPDHEAAGALARRAHFFAGVGRKAPGRGAPFRSERLLFYPCHHDVAPSVVFDVGAGMDAWRRAVDRYESQFRRQEGATATVINAPGFLTAHEGRRARLGQSVGVDFAEGFVVEGPWLAPAALPARGEPQ